MAVQIIPYEDPPLRIPPPPAAGLGRLRKVALLGSHETTLKHAPWEDPSWELWGHASSRGYYKRTPDRLFDLHRKECWTKSNQKGQRYLDFLHTTTIPIYMQERFKEVPAAIRYPLERITAEYRPYFTGHAAYMIALALVEGVTHLGFFGVNYGKSTDRGADCEYGVQRGSCEYWMGVAEAKGVKLVLPKGSTLLADPLPLYGYESHDENGLLVEAYTRRTWLKPEGSSIVVSVPKLASGLAKPPSCIAREQAEEERDHPRPAACLPRPDFSKQLTVQ